MNNYIIWRVVDEYAHHLSWDYKYAGFMFYEDYTGKFQNNNNICLTGIYLKTSTGTDLYLPTWEHCLGTVESRLGPALASEFLHKYVGANGKRAVRSSHLKM